MRGGRLKIVNESRYPTPVVERLVRFGLDDLDVTGRKVLVLVQNNRTHAFRGWASRRSTTDSQHATRLARKFRCDYVIRVLLGKPSQFPIRTFKRNGYTHDYQSWQEVLVGVTAHEAQHVQHYYDGAYRGERVEARCAANEMHKLRRFRALDVRQRTLLLSGGCGEEEDDPARVAVGAAG